MISANQRHFQRMLEVIDAARKDKASLVSVADSLHYLLASLEVIDRQWAEQFGSYVLTLESAGLASPEQRRDMGEAFPALKGKTLDALETMVKARMGGGNRTGR